MTRMTWVSARPLLLGSLSLLCVLCDSVVNPTFLHANPPTASYIFPAGGQKGTTVPVRVGGLFLHDRCRFVVDGSGVTASPALTRAKRLWFEGPLQPLPESQQQEDYPADMSGTVGVAPAAVVGPRRGWVFTSQGGAGGLVFVVGELHEVVETEADGDPIPERVTLPVTANGRVFPRDDTDLWDFDAAAGQTVTVAALAKSLNSPLVPKIEILDGAGHVLTENMTHAVAGADESARFTAPATGRYRVRVGDARGQGGQAYVYRLTLTTAPVPDFHFPPTVTPDGLTDLLSPRDVATAPAALTGRIEAPGAVGAWRVALKKGGRYTLDLQARRVGSPLCGVLTVTDPVGKEVARTEPTDGATDPTLAFTPPADGEYTVRVADRFRTRGGPNFVYRLRVLDGASTPPGFRLALVAENRQPPATPDAFTVLRAATAKIKVNVERTGGFVGPVVLTATDLPKGVTAKPVTIPPNQTTGELTLTADATAPAVTVPLAVVGTGRVGVAVAALTGWAAGDGVPVRVAAVAPGSLLLPDAAPFLTVGVPTPFKIVDEFVMTAAPRGEVYRRKYRVERDAGFTGPLEVRVADHQARHLQGVTGPTITVPAGAAEFEYPATLPPWMELGRTCRVCVAATAKVRDADGTEHTVAFGGTGQNQQMIVVVGPGRLDLALGRQTARAAPGGEARVPFRVTRDRDLSGPVTVEAVIPDHWTGVTAAAVTVPAGAAGGELVVRFAAGESGPFNMPLTVRATLATPRTPITAEAKLEVVK